MDNSKIHIEIGLSRPKFEDMCRLFTTDKNKIDDLVQETMMALLSMNPHTLRDIYNKDGLEGIHCYSAIIIRRACISKKNKFYSLYNKYYTIIDDRYADDTFDNRNMLANIPNDSRPLKDILIDDIEETMAKMYWYDKEILYRYYYKGNTLDTLHEETRIPRGSLFKTIKRARKYIKDVLRK